MSNSKKIDFLFVLGCHRSGTSAMARSLSLRGLNIPSNLLEASEDSNSTGHWEPVEILNHNQSFLSELGLDWHSPEITMISEKYSEMDSNQISKIREILRCLHSDEKTTVIKEPRLNLLIPYYLKALKLENFSYKFIIIHRDPENVVASIIKRKGGWANHLVEANAYLIWLNYTLYGERFSRESDRIFVHFDDLMSNWLAVHRRIETELAISFQKSVSDSQESIDAFLDRKLVHHRTNETASKGDYWRGWIEESYNAQTALERAPYDAKAIGELNAIWRELQRSQHFLSPSLKQYGAKLISAQTDIHNLKLIGAENEQRVNDLERHVENLERQNRELLTQHRNLLQSASWKITQPLRIIVAWLRA